MTKSKNTIDFGAPEEFGAHVFRVVIPQARYQVVRIVEDYGYQGHINGIPQSEERVHLTRLVWSQIADTARKEFNIRLKAANTKTGRWHTGDNFVDRLLGKELCALAWAAETANEEQIPIICRKWSALRPEERWWLFSKAVSEAGLPEDTNRGWRRALFEALSDGKSASGNNRKSRPIEPELVTLPLFKDKNDR